MLISSFSLKYYQFLGLVVNLLILLVIPLSSQHLSAQGKRLVSTQKITLENGLSHRDVNCIHQDQNGYFWFGTDYGLNRYDGYQVEVFTAIHDNLSSDRITHILEDGAGVLWILDVKHYYETRLDILSIGWFDSKELKVLDEKTLFKKEPPFSWDQVQHFFQGESGHLYFHLLEGQTWRYETGIGFKKLDLPTGFRPIQVSRYNALWGQLSNEIQEIDKQGSLKRSFSISPEMQCQLVVEGLDSSVYYKAHLLRKEPYVMAVKPFTWDIGIGAPLPPHISFKLCQSPNRSILKVDYQNKNYWIFGLEWEPFDEDWSPILPLDASMRVRRSIYLKDHHIDPYGNFWFVNKEGVRISRLEPVQFKRYLTQASPNTNRFYSVRGIYPGKDHILLGTNNGNLLLNLNSKQVSETDLNADYGIRNSFFSFSRGSNGKLWGTHHTLVKIDEPKWEVEKEINLPASDKNALKSKIWGRYQSKKGTFWLKKKAYLFSYQPGIDSTLKIFEAYNGFDDLRSELGFHFHENEMGIWIATYKGLFLLDEDQGIIAQYTSDNKKEFSLPSNRIHFIHQVEKDHFLLATADVGLIRWNYNTGEWTSLSRADGLPSNNLYAILEDKNDFFWISSENGIIRLYPDQKNFEFFLDEQVQEHNEFNRLAYHQDNAGYFYFGGIRGLTRFRPTDFVNLKKSAPTLGISKGVVYDKKGMKIRSIPVNISQKQKFRLLSSEKMLELHFSIQDYFQSERNSYWYRSTRPSSDWQKMTGNQLKLGGLAYRLNEFEIRAQGPNGSYPDLVMNLIVYMQAPFYLRWWFLFLMLGLILLMVQYYLRWRTKKLVKQQQYLETEVERRTQQIKKDQVVIESQAAALRALEVEFIDQVDQLILHNLSNSDFTVEELARSVGLSRSQLHRKIKQAVQQTASQRIRKIRFQKAQELLSNPTMTIAEVAFQCGFQDANYFSRLFKQEFGITAKEFREKK